MGINYCALSITKHEVQSSFISGYGDIAVIFLEGLNILLGKDIIREQDGLP